MYKVVDGVLYKEVDTASEIAKIQKVEGEVKPYLDGIKTCEAQIKVYEGQIASYEEKIDGLVAKSGIDPELVKILAPEKADILFS